MSQTYAKEQKTPRKCYDDRSYDDASENVNICRDNTNEIVDLNDVQEENFVPIILSGVSASAAVDTVPFLILRPDSCSTLVTLKYHIC